MTDLDDVLERLRDCEWVDLTHAFEPGIPHYPEFPDEKRSLAFGFKDGDGSIGTGFLVHEYKHVGQWGTHVDPPVHFIEGGRSLDELPVTDMILPIVVLDVREQVASDPDYAADASVVEAFEASHGPIPPGAFVALRTGWDARWPDVAAVENSGHAPGWDVSALRVLVEERGITAIGHDTMDTDPAERIPGGAPAETYILEQDKWQIEVMANLDRVPPRGALIVATWPKPRGGSGFPARCFAIVPRGPRKKGV